MQMYNTLNSHLPYDWIHGIALLSCLSFILNYSQGSLHCCASFCFLSSFKTSIYAISHTTCGKVIPSQLDNLSCSKMLKKRTPSTSKTSSGIECLFSHMLLKILPKVFSFNITEFWAELQEWLQTAICQQQNPQIHVAEMCPGGQF